MSNTFDYQNETLLSSETNSDSNSDNLKIDDELNDDENIEAEIHENTANISDKQEEYINEINQIEINDTCVNAISVANSEEIKLNSDSSTNLIPREGQTMKEDQALIINERKYDIKENILTVLKWIILIILIQNLFTLILIAIYLFTKCYLFALYSFISVFVSFVLNSLISYFWKKLTEEEGTKLMEIFSFEIIKFSHYKCYKECIESYKLLKESVRKQRSIYKETIRKIEDLRYYIITTALLYGSIQILVQLYILINMYDNIFTLPFQIILLLISGILIFLSIFIIRCKFCDFKNDLGIYRISMFMFFITLTSTFLYLLDIFSDFAVAIRYFYDSHFIRGTVTFLLILLPGVFNTWHEHFRQKLAFKIERGRIITMLLNLNPVFGYLNNLKFQVETRKAEKENNEKLQIISYLSYTKNNFIVASSRYNECFTESCSQLIVQISFLLSRINFSDLQNEKFTILSSGISVLNVAVSLVLFFRAKRIRNFEEDPLPVEGMAVQFIGYIPVASRIVALGFLASVHPYITFLVMFLHWLVIFIWILYTSRRYSLPLCLNSAGQAIFYTYTPAINSSVIEIIFQSVFFSENIAAILLWNYSKYKRFTTNGILILIFAIIVPSFIGCICRYFYRKKYETWIDNFKNVRSKRMLIPC